MTDYDDAVTADSPVFYDPLDATPAATLLESGSVTYTTDGPNGGGAAVLTGGAYLYAPPTYPAALRPTVAVSVEIWVRTTSTNSMFVATPAYPSGPYGYDLGMFPSNARFETGQGGPSSLTSPGAVNDGAWHHIVGTTTSGDRRLYVDGTLAASDTRPGLIDYQASGLYGVGRRDDGYVLTGEVAAVAVYDTVLTADRVAAHYAASRAGGGGGEPEPVYGAVAFTGSVSFTADPPVVTIGDVGAVWFTGSVLFDAVTRPVGRRRRLVVVDVFGEPVGELENANVGGITFTLNEPDDFAFTLPLSDPKAALLLAAPFPEVQVWRGDRLLTWGPVVRPSADKATLGASCRGVLWYLTRRTIGRASRTNHVPNGDFDDGLTGWEVGALSPLEATVNRDPANWDGEITTTRALTGRHALLLRQIAPGLPKYGVSASTFFVWDVDAADTPEGDAWSLVAWCFIPPEDWGGPPASGVGLQLARYSTTETVAIRRDDGSAPIDYPKPIEAATQAIDADTPRGVWHRLEVALHTPVTGQPEFVQVTLGCPVGSIVWDRVSLTRDEALRFYGVDQASIVAGIVEHVQDPAYGKSPLNLSTDTPPTGVLRDRTYLHHEHLIAADCVDEFTSLADGLDVSVVLTASTRTVRTDHPRRGRHRPALALTLGRTIADFAWTFNGETAANAVIVLGTGDGSDREEAAATNPAAFAGGLTLETTFAAPPDHPIDSLDDVAVEALAVAVGPELLSVTTTPGYDPAGVLAPGDTVPVMIRTGALLVEDTYRIVELTINPDDSLALTLNRRDP